MTAAHITRITQSDFETILARPENQDRQLELWDGEIIETVPRPLHGYMQNRFSFVFSLYLQTNPIGTVFTELQVSLPGTDYSPVPDVAFVSHARGPFDWERPLPFMPDLIVEIQSPGQSERFMAEKAQFYLTHGAQIVILVYLKRIIEVLTTDSRQLLVMGDTLPGDPVLPGFSVPVADLFPPAAG